MPETEPEQIFTLPEELMSRMQTATQTPKRVMRTEQIQLKRDNTPVLMFGDPEIINGSSGPMLVRKRRTTVTMFHEDGTSSRVPIDGQQRYIDKGFSTAPMAEKPSNTKICQYCFKKFRPSTDREIAMNTRRTTELDEETKRLLEEMGSEYGNLDRSVGDVEFKLAEHIRIRHGKLASFTADPLLKRLRERNS